MTDHVLGRGFAIKPGFAITHVYINLWESARNVAVLSWLRWKKEDSL